MEKEIKQDVPQEESPEVEEKHSDYLFWGAAAVLAVGAVVVSFAINTAFFVWTAKRGCEKALKDRGI